MIRHHALVVSLVLSTVGAAGVSPVRSVPAQPHAEPGARPAKALSDREIGDLRAGRGMGMALAAELNGHPGPLHVLEHAEALMLTPAQRRRTEGLLAAMRAEAVPLGVDLIRREAELERLFVTRTATPANLEAATAAAGATQGALRAAHLRYHLAMTEVLAPDQVRRYDELRGHAGRSAPTGHGGHRRAR